MATHTDLQPLYDIQHTVDTIGVKSAIVYPASRLIEIEYNILGQGCVLSNAIVDILGERDYRIKMIPSEKKLTVELR